MVTVLNNKIVLDETDEVLPEKISEKFTKIKILNKSTSENALLCVTKADSSASGPNITLDRESTSPANNDILGKIQFKGRNDQGNSIRFASINAKIKDVREGEDDSALEFTCRKAGQPKPLLVVQPDGIFAFNDLPLVLKTASGKTTRIKGTSTTKRNITFPDSNGEVMVNDSGKVMVSNLPTSDPNNAGQLWNDSGTLKISAG